MRWVPVALVTTLVIGACGYQEGAIQRAERSYLKFSGNVGNAIARVDDGPPFVLLPGDVTQADGQSVPGTLYQVPPGRHRVTVTREGQVVVDRILMLNDKTTMEVPVP